jgi:hypothetical protein
MYNFYLIAHRAEAPEPVFEKIVFSEEDAKVAGFEEFEDYVSAALDKVVEECVKEELNYIILNQEEYMRLILKMGQKM